VSEGCCSALAHAAGSDLIPKIADFGLAKRLDAGPGQTQTGAILGTPSYMAPEQAAGETKHVGPAADVYALGAILYECLTGRPPFKAATVLDTLVQVRAREPVAVRQLQPGAPRDLETICLKCLRKDPKGRYASADALADDLERFLSGRPIAARPVPAAERVWKWARRHPVVAGLALALVAALAGGFAGVFSQWRRAEANFAEADAQRRRAEASLRLAREAVDRMLTEVGDERLRSLPGMQPVRGRLLREAAEFYEKFLGEHGDDPSLRADAARARFRVGEIYNLLGRYKESEKALSQALEEQQALIDLFPDEPRFRRELAETCLESATLHLMRGRFGEGEPLLRRGIAVHEEAGAGPPEDGESARVQARLESHLALVCSQTRRQKEAEAHYRKALVIARPLADRNPDRNRYAYVLGLVVNNLGVLYKETGQFAKAADAFREAIAVWEKILVAEPGAPEIQAVLASSCYAMGSLEYYYLGQAARAEKPYLRSLELREQLARANPSVTSFRKDLAQTHWALAWLHLQLDRPEQVAAAGARARALQEELVAAHPDTPACASDLAATYQFLGWFHASRRELPEARAAYGKARGILRRLAGGHREVAEYQQRLSQVLHDLGILYWERYKDADRAEACYLEAAALREGLARATPADSQVREDLAWTWDNLSDALQATGQQGKAAAAFDKARALREQLAREHPAVQKYAYSLAVNCRTMGTRLLGANKPAEALAWFQRAIAGLQPIVEREPKARESRNALLFAHWERARALDDLGRYSEALADWGRALSLDAGDHRHPVSAGRATALARLGRHAEAVGTAEPLLTDKSLTPSLVYWLAGVYSLSSEAARKDLALDRGERGRRTERYREQALALLQKAQAAGFFRTREGALGVMENPTLTPMHKNPRFRAWLDRLEKTMAAKGG
jgi:tetratricopeptide (TPR) repeat protein